MKDNLESRALQTRHNEEKMGIRKKTSGKSSKFTGKAGRTGAGPKIRNSSAPELHLFLKEKRIASQLSQAEVARQLGYSSPQFISNWERGLVLPPLQTMSNLVKLYKLNREDLIERLVQHSRAEIESHLKSRR